MSPKGRTTNSKGPYFVLKAVIGMESAPFVFNFILSSGQLLNNIWWRKIGRICRLFLGDGSYSSRSVFSKCSSHCIGINYRLPLLQTRLELPMGWCLVGISMIEKFL